MQHSSILKSVCNISSRFSYTCNGKNRNEKNRNDYIYDGFYMKDVNDMWITCRLDESEWTQ